MGNIKWIGQVLILSVLIMTPVIITIITLLSKDEENDDD